MTLPGGWLLPAVWFLCGATVVVSALLAARSRTAYRTGIWATAFLWVNAGAAVNLAFLLTDHSYEGFADGSWSGFVTETWESLVVPHEAIFIGLLVVGEAAAGLFVLVPGRLRQWALSALIAFNVLLVSFGVGFLVWSVPLIVALSLLLRAGERWASAEPTPRAPIAARADVRRRG